MTEAVQKIDQNNEAIASLALGLHERFSGLSSLFTAIGNDHNASANVRRLAAIGRQLACDHDDVVLATMIDIANDLGLHEGAEAVPRYIAEYELELHDKAA
ncbi:hypothetical protein [Parahaliea aestuarii]|uniref:Uncharacterized protein n=1 Tax=Parahaliea aestuarii TaxID=1852021 RepID=A0A5C8ZP86_9GAMM|nr:hypothetical protein [Parahaliea aestuarii]TXS89574.1 hypothetical protein FVW59_16270 [Parahaliea aestuarii]